MLVRSIRRPYRRLFTSVMPRRRVSLTPWLGAAVMLAVAAAVGLSVYAGQWLGNRLMAPGEILAPERNVSVRLDPSFTQGYVDGIREGRRAAEASPTRLEDDQVKQAVLGSLPAQTLFVRGESYGEGFKRGAEAGMRQRMHERFGRGGQETVTPRRVVIIDPSYEKGLRVTETPMPDQRPVVVVNGTPVAGATPAPNPAGVAQAEPDPPAGGPIKRKTLPDGTVEYSNI